jgi:hypothetical protein
MTYALCSKYGDLGRIAKDEIYYTPPMIDTSLYDPTKDTHGLMLDALRERVKERLKIIATMQNNRTSCYNFIMSKLSRESKDELKRCPDYEFFNGENDPLALWLALKSLHLTTTLSKNSAIIFKQASDDYKSCYQSEFESISTFKERFETKLEAYTKNGGTVEDSTAAIDFLFALSKAHYAEFQAQKLNQMNSDPKRYTPKTVNEIYVFFFLKLISLF